MRNIPVRYLTVGELQDEKYEVGKRLIKLRQTCWLADHYAWTGQRKRLEARLVSRLCDVRSSLATKYAVARREIG